MPKFGTRNGWSVCFGARIWKEYFYIWIQHPRICLIPKFRRKAQMPKCGIKNVLFGYSLARILNIILSYIKWAGSNLCNCKI